MFENLDPELRFAVMKILAATYESGRRAGVDLRDVMGVLGLEYDGDTPDKLMVDFDSEEFIEEYVLFKEGELDQLYSISKEELLPDSDDDEDEASLYTPVVDVVNNLTYIDICIVQKNDTDPDGFPDDLYIDGVERPDVVGQRAGDFNVDDRGLLTERHAPDQSKRDQEKQ